MLPAPAKTAAGGQKEDMAADIPTTIEIGIIKVVGGYVSESEQAQEYENSYELSTHGRTVTYKLRRIKFTNHSTRIIGKYLLSIEDCVCHVSQIVAERSNCKPDKVGFGIQHTLTEFWVGFTVCAEKPAWILSVIGQLKYPFLDILDYRSADAVRPVHNVVWFGPSNSQSVIMDFKDMDIYYSFLNHCPMLLLVHACAFRLAAALQITETGSEARSTSVGVLSTGDEHTLALNNTGRANKALIRLAYMMLVDSND